MTIPVHGSIVIPVYVGVIPKRRVPVPLSEVKAGLYAARPRVVVIESIPPPITIWGLTVTATEVSVYEVTESVARRVNV